MKTIVVSVTNDLVVDQRVHKVCTTLQEMGFSIHLVGRKLKNSLSIHRNYKTTRIKLLFNKGPLFYAEYNFRLFCFLLFTKKDILLSNDLDTLLPNFLVSKICHKPIVYDSHELFTEVPELIHRPRIQKTWLTIEQFIFPKLKDIFTVCFSIADYYEKKYHVALNILRNVPVSVNETNTVDHEILSFIENKQAVIYQGAVNIGRGIELMIDVVSQMENTVLCVFGDGDIYDKIAVKIKEADMEDKVLLYGKVPPKDLKSITPLFDVGLSLEENLGMNYKYALPNKLFDYIHAEIPCLVSNLPEMKHLVKAYNVGEVVDTKSIKSIVVTLQKLITNKNDYKESFILAKQDLNWEKESEVIKQVYSKFL
ncbi:glycosyltransferase [Wenyingzhuangia sp. chi5]|uniref:Glycosyltransferase n=1 Tax=Wenyingzhuangia gilva TaxID=3057677 RepID=A0ABT8VPE1_9FLAO|nr:glycosyltransferase [Wenyingzhuangia sp. chi5]MDO3693839.1 glycosyltransferase [Wenyingzhuangia sp. chi5]